MSIRELPHKSAGILAAPLQRMKMHGVDAANPPVKVAANVSEKGMLRLLNKFPGGEASDEILDAHMRKIKEYARRMREAGMDVSKYNIPSDD